MLGMICPICSAPLMSSKEKLHCPGCDMPVRYETPADQEQSRAALPARADRHFEDAEEEDEEEEDQEADVPESLEEMKKEYDLKRKSRDAVSKKLGEKMLEGWTLLGVTCSESACLGTPLMHSLKDPSRLVCMSCNKEYKKTGFGTIEAVGASKNSSDSSSSKSESNSKSMSKSESSAVPLFSDAPILDFSRSRRETDSSSKIAEKLVKGWALLNEVCQSPACNGMVPLLRDTNGVKHCVECSSASAASAPRQATAPAKMHRRGAAFDDDEDEQDDDEDDEEDDAEEEDEEEDAQDSAAYAAYARKRLAGARKSRAPGVSTPPSLPSAETQALAILRKKLIASAQLLQASSDTSESIRLAVLINKLANAIKSLSAAR